MKFDVQRVALVLQRVLGVLTAAMVIGVYAFAMSRGKMPPSHPWSGLTLGLLSARAIFFPVRSDVRPSAPGWIVSGLALAGALMWGWSAHLGR